MIPSLTLVILVLGLPSAAPGGSPSQEPPHGVRAVLFHSPACGHCRTVLTRDIPPLEARWGTSLEILRVDVTTPAGERLYLDAVASLPIPRGRLGVPTLIVGSHVLVGSGEIPQRLPGLVEDGMAGRGVAWPPVPGLDAYRARLAMASPAEAAAAPPAPPGVPEGALLAWTALALLVTSLVRAGRWILRSRGGRATRLVLPTPGHHVSLWALLGLGTGTAGYLSATALSAAETACGPVGDCAAVHASAYAQVLGLPVALMGVGFYVILGALWYLASRDGKGGGWLVAISLLGVVFSLHLTAMEIFVIRAVCVWCLGSALAAAGLLWLAVSALRPLRTAA